MLASNNKNNPHSVHLSLPCYTHRVAQAADVLTKKRLRHLYDQIDDDSTSMKACLLTLCLYPDRAVVSEAIALLMQFAEGTKRIIRVAKLTRVVSVEGNYENFQHVSERAPCLHLWL